VNELQELQSLLQELLQAIDVMQQSGEEMSDELMGAIAQTLEALFNRIEDLEGSGVGAPPIPPQRPDINQAMPSSNIEGFAYDDKNNRLYVRFLGKYPQREGPIYQYEGVPQDIFTLFQRGAVPARSQGQNRWGRWWRGKVPSMGASMYTLIKQMGYPYQRVA